MFKSKLAILTSHPVQYQAPLFRKLTSDERIDLTVYFKERGDENGPVFDEQFGQKIKWDIPLLEGYRYKFLKGYWDIIHQIKTDRPDVLLVHGWNALTYWIAFMYARWLGIPILLHGESSYNQESKGASFKNISKKIIFKTFFKGVSGFLYIGKQNKKFYESYGVPVEKLFFMPYAVENKRWEEVKEKINRVEVRKEMGITEEEIVILFAGKLMIKKNPISLLRAFEKIRQKRKKIRLIYVGDGELKEKIKSYTEKHKIKGVNLVGFKNQTEIGFYYAVADIFVLPSGKGETWGLVVNEAMCFGLPIIASDLPGVSFDLIRENKNGLKFKFGDENELAEKIIELVDDKEKREKFGKKSLEIIKDYSYEKDVEGVRQAINFVKQ